MRFLLLVSAPAQTSNTTSSSTRGRAAVYEAFKPAVHVERAVPKLHRVPPLSTASLALVRTAHTGARAPWPHRYASPQPRTVTWDRGRYPPPLSPIRPRCLSRRTPESSSVFRSLGSYRCP